MHLHFPCEQPMYQLYCNPLPTPKHLMLKPTLKMEYCVIHINGLQLILTTYLSENCYHLFFPISKIKNLLIFHLILISAF